MSEPERMFTEGVALHQQGRLEDAARLYRDVLRLQPDHVNALHLLALAELQAHRPGPAVALVRRALALDGANATAHVTLGNGLRDLKRPDEALASYDTAIGLAPDLPWAWYNRGNALLDLSRADDALASFDKAIAVQPDNAEAFSGRGNAFAKLSRPADAVVNFNKAIALRPGFVEAYCNRGNVLLELMRHEDGISSYDQAIALQPDHAPLHCNRANALVELGRSEEAIPGFDKAVSLDPDYAAAHWNKGLCLLRMGRFDEGWRLFEWRKKLESCDAARSYPQPLWLGDQDISGKTLFLYAEQGLGDTIQFCRYATLAADAGARVILEVQEPLAELMKTLRGVAEIVVAGNPPPDFDLQSPLMSLPLAFGTTLASVPSGSHYLRAEPDRAASWRDRLAGLRGTRVGLVWAGHSPMGNPVGIAIDRRRSLPLREFAPLASVDGCSFVSLQLGPAGAEASEPPAGMMLYDHTDGLKNFADTAALIENLDLIIGVDTSTPHLAAAMGKPVWLLNRFDTCWRWLLDRDDSPWYPTMTLFRQQRLGDWAGVAERAADALRSFRR